MGSTKPYVHPHPVAKMFCFRRCTQQHQPSTSASCARTLCWHQKKSESESKFWMGKYPIGHLFLFWDCDSEILFLPVKNHPKKEFRTLSNEEIISSTPNEHLHPGRFWGFFCYENTWWKEAPLGPVDQWYESWSPKTCPVNSGISRKYLDFCPFHSTNLKGRDAGLRVNKSCVVWCPKYPFHCRFLSPHSPENCGLFEESIEICLMEQTVRKPSVTVHLTEHLRTPSNVASIPSRQVGLKKDKSSPMIKDAIGGTTIENKEWWVFFSALDQEFHVWDMGLMIHP